VIDAQVFYPAEMTGILIRWRRLMADKSARRFGFVFEGREWVVLLRGVMAITFAVAALTWPAMTQAKLVTLFGVYALAHGALSLVAAIGGRGRLGCVLLGTEGAIGLIAGLLALESSLPSPLKAIGLMWLWAAATGILQIVEAIRFRREVSGNLWLALGGLVMLCFGWTVWLRPFIGMIGLAVAIAALALLWGVFEILLGKELRAMRYGRLAGRI
jgi:uncharacterized membrane protein HdeD (DUF308 family)